MKTQQFLTFVGLQRWLPFIAVLLLLSCSRNQVAPDEPEVAPTDLSQLSLAPDMLRGGDAIAPPEPIGEPGEGGEIVPTVRDGLKGVIISRSSMYSAGVVYNEYLLFNPMSNLIYPGNVLVGNSINNGRYLPVRGQKIGEVTWSSPDMVPLNPQEMRFVKTVNEPRFSDYASTMQEWRGTPQLPTSAVTTFEMTEVKDLREFSAKLGMGFESENAKAGIVFEGKRGLLRTHILVKFVQKLYSVSMDIPNRQHLLSASPNALGGVMPVYISDVFYGRMGYALISSDHDYREVLAALEIMVPKFHFELSAKYKKILDETFTQYVFTGGKSGDHGLSVKEGWEGFKEGMSTELLPSEAVPVAITLRYADDNSVARVVQSGQYPVTESYFVKDCDEITFSLRPAQLKANAGTKDDLQVWGHTVLTVPRELSTTGESTDYRLVWIPMSKYIKLDKQKQSGLPSAENTTITIKRPEGMSMQDFLNQRVYIDTHFYNTNAAGTITGDDLGESKYSIRLQDLLFNAVHHSLTVTTRKNASRDYSATVLFDLFHDIKEVEEIPNGLRSVTVEGDQPNTTTTRCLGSQPRSYFNQK